MWFGNCTRSGFNGEWERSSILTHVLWGDGRVSVVLDGVELMEKLAALVPRPREHEVFYYGVFAPHAKLRGQVVPGAKRKKQKGTSDGWIRWAELLKRVWGRDELTCERCGSRMQVIAYVRKRESVRKFLGAVGVSAPAHRS